MSEHLNKEISEKYRLLFFTKKMTFFTYVYSKQSSNIFKWLLKNRRALPMLQLMEWMQSSLVCDKSEYHFMIENQFRAEI